MKKKAYTIITLLTASLIACVFIFGKTEKKEVLTYLERNSNIGLNGEWLETKKAIEGLLYEIKTNPSNTKSKLNLAQAYIQESRITGTHNYYDQAAMELLDNVLQQEPENFEAICCKATVLLSQHHFDEALQLSKGVVNMNPNSAFIYGVLCDANLELGNYEEAVENCDKMVNLRPDIRSYSRVSYIREIYGNYKGAIAAAKLAVNSGYPGLEQTAWTRCILGHLYEVTDQLDSAENQYNLALYERPNYAYAYAGLGRIEKYKGNYKKAIDLCHKAKAILNDYSFDEELMNIYLVKGDTNEALRFGQKAINNLIPTSQKENFTNAHGHYSDKELASLYIKTGNFEKAIEHGLLEYSRRPKNIEVCEVLAWAYYKNGDLWEANHYLTNCFTTLNKNPILNYRTFLIKKAVGEHQFSSLVYKRANMFNSHLDPLLLKEVNIALVNN